MTQEELLKRAKEHYPVGTVFMGIFAGSSFDKACIVTGSNFWQSENGITVDSDRPHENVRNSGTFVYYKDNWAKRVSVPEQVTINKYEIF